MKTVFIDENLPKSIGRQLGRPAIHATDSGERMSDHNIWDQGRINDWIVLTKDADFFDRLMLHGPPPQIVWIRVGNVRRKHLEDRIVRAWTKVEEMLKVADLVEIHDDRLEAIIVRPSEPNA